MYDMCDIARLGLTSLMRLTRLQHHQFLAFPLMEFWGMNLRERKTEAVKLRLAVGGVAAAICTLSLPFPETT